VTTPGACYATTEDYGEEDAPQQQKSRGEDRNVEKTITHTGPGSKFAKGRKGGALCSRFRTFAIAKDQKVKNVVG